MYFEKATLEIVDISVSDIIATSDGLECTPPNTGTEWG